MPDAAPPDATTPDAAPSSPTTGRWRMRTESSTYLLDLDAGTATRLADGGAGTAPGQDSPAITMDLRRDGLPLPLLEQPTITVGAPAVLLLDVRGDGIPTTRVTTHVRSLEPVTP